MPTEADTCRKFVVPKLQAAGWDNEPHSIAEQRTITDGRIIPVGKGFVRKPPKRVDYLLRYEGISRWRSWRPKPLQNGGRWRPAGQHYAEMLDLKFAYATNGHEIIEFDYFTGLETPMTTTRRPPNSGSATRRQAGFKDQRRADQLLTPFNHTAAKASATTSRSPSTARLRPFSRGRRRFLLTMATGTGKTSVAFQICWKLWTAAGTARESIGGRAFSILRTAIFSSISPRTASSRPLAMPATRSNPAKSSTAARCTSPSIRPSPRMSAGRAFSKAFAPDFFDLVIVDECHRGSARDDSSWRDDPRIFRASLSARHDRDAAARGQPRHLPAISATRFTSTACAKALRTASSPPIASTGSITQWDAAGWRPSQAELDRYGRTIPDEEYQTKDFERVVALRARTEAIARHLTEFLKKSDRFAKTIVFCVDQEHANDMRAALSQPQPRSRGAIP